MLLVAGVLGSIVAVGYIHFSYDASMPRSPQPSEGRVYCLTVNHGDRVYVNQYELNRANFVFHDISVLGLACVLALVFVKQYWAG